MMAGAGGSVWICDLPEANPAAVAEAIGATACTADVTDPNAVRSAFERIPDLSIAVVNAGIARRNSLFETTAGEWERVLRVNLTGAFHTLKMAAEQMKKRGGGAIVVTASTNSFDGEPELIAYNASKAGLLGIIHTAANELGPYGIRVNAVCPGLIRTRLTADSFSDSNLLKEYFRHIPLGRGGEPKDVAQAVLFVASDMASYITGATLFVDGGQMASKFGPWGQEQDQFDGQRWIRSSGSGE
jgi:NAD(P)-dependent dehydrogenase (short-subunit alcohol dehydrogenase family)